MFQFKEANDTFQQSYFVFCELDTTDFWKCCKWANWAEFEAIRVWRDKVDMDTLKSTENIFEGFILGQGTRKTVQSQEVSYSWILKDGGDATDLTAYDLHLECQMGLSLRL
eukprot:GHVS01101178.1.p1 GENE.GHVS01101178.1~~GHVS01101178.1.p1  ORF type:complete len:111 (+),score=1.04 GHVS01101178.1:534-866(+)